MEIVIVGAGAHGRDLEAICEAAGHKVVEFVDQKDGFRSDKTVIPDHIGRLIGIYSCDARSELDRRANTPVVVHPGAHVDPSCDLGEGTVVADAAVLGNDVTTGRHVHINLNSTLVRCTIGDYSTIAPGVTVCGDVTIGQGVLIGAGAVIKNLISIGDWATIGAGAVVVEDVLAHSTVVSREAKAVNVVEPRYYYATAEMPNGARVDLRLK